MSAISAANSSATSAIALLLSNAASTATAAGTPATKATTSGSSASSNPADTVALSDSAKAALASAATDQAATADLTLSFDESLTKRTDALSAKLSQTFAALNVNLDQPVELEVDKFGNVTTEGPWKKKIEKLFADDPELAKEFKAVAGLSSLKAALIALDLYNEEKGATAGSRQQQQAWTNYNIQSMNIQTLSGLMTLKNGNLSSAAVDYINILADPNGTDGAGSDPAQKQRDIASLLA